MYPGIDYGQGKTNIDKTNDIRFGVISQHSLMSESLNDFDADYGPPHCSCCGDEAVDYDDEKHGEYNGRGCCDFACESCERFFDSSDAYGDEPICHFLNDGEYKATMGSDGDIFLLKSPFYTHAQFCSPCAPGAGHLDNPCDDGPKTYCFGHDWFEGDEAPYPVFSVRTGEPVQSERQQREDNEPQEGDYVTENHINWYEAGTGKPLLTTADPDDPHSSASNMVELLKQHMEEQQFWPNCFWISDHGNAHRISLCGGCENNSGVRIDATPHSGTVPRGFTCVERCDACGKYSSDKKAAEAIGTNVIEREKDTICIVKETK